MWSEKTLKSQLTDEAELPKENASKKTSTTAFRERLDKTDASMLWFIWLISLFLIAQLKAQQVSFGDEKSFRKSAHQRSDSDVRQMRNRERALV